MNRSSRPRVASIRAAFTIAVVAGGAFALAGCSTVADIVSAATEGANSSAPETRSEDTGEIVAGGVTDVFQLRVGDCLNDPGSDEVLEVVTVPCADPHDYEVYHHAELEDGEHERLARHVSACPDCFHATEAEEHIRALIRRSCEEHAPASLRVRVMTQIQVLRLGGPGVSR